MVIKSSATLDVRGQRHENVRGKWEDVVTRGLIPSPPRGPPPQAGGFGGRKSPREWRKGDSIVRLSPQGRDYGGTGVEGRMGEGILRPPSPHWPRPQVSPGVPREDGVRQNPFGPPTPRIKFLGR